MDTEPKASATPEGDGAAKDGPEVKTSAESAVGGDTKVSTPEGAVAIDGSDVISQPVTQTQYKMLDDALATSRPASEGGRAYVHPVLFDCILACGLLIAMGGFTIGLLKIYITHSAQQSIQQHNYKAAIAILRGAPFPGLFTVKNMDPSELLNQALYLEAMDTVDSSGDINAAVQELTQIQPGSKFFDLAQEYISDHTDKSDVQLQGAAQHQASPSDRVVEDPMPPIPAENK